MSGSTKVLDQPSKLRAPQPKPTGLRSTPERQRQAPWVVLGLLLVAGAGLGFAIWSTSLSDRRPVLVAARTIQTGEQLAATDLRVVTIGADSGVELVGDCLAFGVTGSSFVE